MDDDVYPAPADISLRQRVPIEPYVVLRKEEGVRKCFYQMAERSILPNTASRHGGSEIPLETFVFKSICRSHLGSDSIYRPTVPFRAGPAKALI